MRNFKTAVLLFLAVSLSIICVATELSEESVAGTWLITHINDQKITTGDSYWIFQDGVWTTFYAEHDHKDELDYLIGDGFIDFGWMQAPILEFNGNFMKVDLTHMTYSLEKQIKE